MTQDFILIHRTGPERFRLPEVGPDGLEAFSFMTCLRHIVIADVDTVSRLAEQSFDQAVAQSDDQAGIVLRGEDAYRFVLEVICGLHSPLVGETEVAGQFKNTVAAFSYPATPWGSALAKTFKALFEDAKKVRDAHLKDLGSQSYGSVLRREIRGHKNVHILGAGHLVQEILPWIMKEGIDLTIHVRDVVKASRELTEKIGKSSQVRIVPVGTSVVADALVIAAPVSSEFVAQWSSGADFVADLRADSAQDRLTGFERVLELGEFMSRLTENQTLLEERKRLALNAISKAALERTRTVEYRPFGWEDVCA